MKMVNKRGQQMTLGTIIAIVLGIAVLVFLIFGFSTGWNNMWNKITAFGGGAANVDTVVQGCDLACAQGGVNAFCVQERTVKYGDGDSDTGSCQTFLNNKDSVKIKVKDCSLSCVGVEVPPLNDGNSEDDEEEDDAEQSKVDDAELGK